MPSQQVVWKLQNRDMEPRGVLTSAIGLNVSYPDRECDIRIVLPQPVDIQIQQTEFALAELRRLRDALNSILTAQ